MLTTMELTPGRWVRHDDQVFQVTDWHPVHGSGEVRVTLVTGDELGREVVVVPYEELRQVMWELV
jgi:hypothetical protein